MGKNVTWAFIVSGLFVASLVVGGYALSNGSTVLGLIALALAIFFAKDFADVAHRKLYRKIRRESYVSSGAWKSRAVPAPGKSDSFRFTMPADSYFTGVFASVPPVNPATGLPMMGGASILDVGGNVFGVGGAVDFGGGVDGFSSWTGVDVHGMSAEPSNTDFSSHG